MSNKIVDEIVSYTNNITAQVDILLSEAEQSLQDEYEVFLRNIQANAQHLREVVAADPRIEQLANTSQDIRSKISAMLSYSDLMLRRPDFFGQINLNKAQADVLREINETSQRLMDVVNARIFNRPIH